MFRRFRPSLGSGWSRSPVCWERSIPGELLPVRGRRPRPRRTRWNRPACADARPGGPVAAVRVVAPGRVPVLHRKLLRHRGHDQFATRPLRTDRRPGRSVTRPRVGSQRVVDAPLTRPHCLAPEPQRRSGPLGRIESVDPRRPAAPAGKRASDGAPPPRCAQASRTALGNIRQRRQCDDGAGSVVR